MRKMGRGWLEDMGNGWRESTIHYCNTTAKHISITLVFIENYEKKTASFSCLIPS